MTTSHLSHRAPFIPDSFCPVAPGELLQEKLKEMGMTTQEFCAQSSLSMETVELLYNGEIPLEPALAEKLETITNTPEDYWLCFERIYRDELSSVAEKMQVCPNRVI